MEEIFKEYNYKGQKFKIYFIAKDKLGPIFGMAYFKEGKGLYGEINKDLSPVIKKFVIEHELYHLTDSCGWMGRFGMKLRASIIPGLKNPIGLFAVIFATIFSFERIKFYFNKIKNKLHL